MNGQVETAMLCIKHGADFDTTFQAQNTLGEQITGNALQYLIAFVRASSAMHKEQLANGTWNQAQYEAQAYGLIHKVMPVLELFAISSSYIYGEDQQVEAGENKFAYNDAMLSNPEEDHIALRVMHNLFQNMKDLDSAIKECNGNVPQILDVLIGASDHESTTEIQRVLFQVFNLLITNNDPQQKVTHNVIHAALQTAKDVSEDNSEYTMPELFKIVDAIIKIMKHEQFEAVQSSNNWQDLRNDIEEDVFGKAIAIINGNKIGVSEIASLIRGGELAEILGFVIVAAEEQPAQAPTQETEEQPTQELIQQPPQQCLTHGFAYEETQLGGVVGGDD
mgnify:CR=1 FL=1